MTILAIETTGALCSVALLEKNALKSSMTFYDGKAHDRLLAEYTRRTLSDAEISLKDIDCIALSIGPGSFTGVRIGVSFAKGLCTSLRKILPIPTLSVVAFQAQKTALAFQKSHIIAIIPSHRDLYYIQIFETHTCSAISEARILPAENLIEFAQESLKLYAKTSNLQLSDVVLWNGSGLFREASTQFAWAAQEVGQPTAENCAHVASWFIMNEQFSLKTGEEVEPLYIQEFIPKIN